MIKILHFSDAHIDIANYGRRDPVDGLPVRVKDFLASLDEIVDAAMDENVDLVIFTGDAFKDRNPSPTFQREWAKRIHRLSDAKKETIIVVGNHDRSASIAHANALEVYKTLQIPHVHVCSHPTLLQPKDLNDVAINIVVIPWLMREGMMEYLEMTHEEVRKKEVGVYQDLLKATIDEFLEDVDATLPTMLAAHASVESAIFGEEKNISIGGEFILPLSLVKDSRFDYVALGHIHRAQNLNKNNHPPVIYAGSIERVSFGEAKEAKFYMLAEISKGETKIDWRELKNIRTYLDLSLDLREEDNLMEKIMNNIPQDDTQKDAVVRMILEYNQEDEPNIDENRIRKQFDEAFSFSLVKRPTIKNRLRLGDDANIIDLTEDELLKLYWESKNVESEKIQEWIAEAKTIIQQTNMGEEQS